MRPEESPTAAKTKENSLIWATVTLVLKAVQNGYRARFIRAQDLFDEMYASIADRSSRKLLNTLVNVDVLAIDLC